MGYFLLESLHHIGQSLDFMLLMEVSYTLSADGQLVCVTLSVDLLIEHSLQNSVASLSSHPSHTIWFGSAKRLLTENEDEDEAVTSIVEAKWLTGRDEAAAVGVVTFPFCFFGSITAVADVGISKTARHTGHLKGA